MRGGEKGFEGGSVGGGGWRWRVGGSGVVGGKGERALNITA